jgi:hypothetical protein
VRPSLGASGASRGEVCSRELRKRAAPVSIPGQARLALPAAFLDRGKRVGAENGTAHVARVSIRGLREQGEGARLRGAPLDRPAVQGRAGGVYGGLGRRVAQVRANSLTRLEPHAWNAGPAAGRSDEVGAAARIPGVPAPARVAEPVDAGLRLDPRRRRTASACSRRRVAGTVRVHLRAARGEKKREQQRQPDLHRPIYGAAGRPRHRSRRMKPTAASSPTMTRYATAQSRSSVPPVYPPPNGPSWSRNPVRPVVFAMISRRPSW